MIKTEKNETEYYSYPDYPAFVAHATQTLGDMDIKGRSSRTTCRSRTGGSGFYGKLDWEEASKMGLSGDMDTARTFKQKTLEYANRFLAEHPRLDPRYMIDGGMWVDINRYLRGEPECWGDLRHDAEMHRPSLALVINVACNSWAGSEDMEKWGSEIAGVVLALQARGYPATVHIAEKTKSNDDSYIVHFPLNPNGTLLDMSYFAASLQPWFFRRLIFNWSENMPKDFRDRYSIKRCGGYGQSEILNAKDVQQIARQCEHQVVINRENTVGEKLQEIANRILQGTEVGVA